MSDNRVYAVEMLDSENGKWNVIKAYIYKGSALRRYGGNPNFRVVEYYPGKEL
ncbi:orf24 [Lactobacillus phage LP65]|uniref:Orf24 n=1 Tax=Lactobacillus phage LP65 TaxID=2892344 RepID=Q5ULU0_9CAUD|nr:hypothetical protein LP65_gp024 [Lactobacillus phage LP65]AAV35844.1 orf24 [Lactobacillus phage LP65]